MTDEVTPFTGSLVVYPLLLVGEALTRTGRAGPGYWLAFSGFGVLFLAAVHAGPTAIEPRRDIVDVHATALLGWSAYGWLLALFAVLVLHVGVCAAWWQAERRHRSTDRRAGSAPESAAAGGRAGAPA